MGVEPTCDTECRTLVLKTRPSTGQDWLPKEIVTEQPRPYAGISVLRLR